MDKAVVLVFPDSLSALNEAMGVLVAAATLLEPEEITAVAEGKITAAEVLALLPDRLPGGPNFSVARLTRGLGIRTAAEDFEAFWEKMTAPAPQ